MSAFDWKMDYICGSETYQLARGLHVTSDISRLVAENEALRARIAELEKARDVIDTGWVIVGDLLGGPAVWTPPTNDADSAWSAFTIDRKWHEDRGYRAVKVAVVRVEE